MTLELAMYFLSGVLFVVCCLIGVVYKDNKDKLSEHSRQIEQKASSDRLSELENKLSTDMKSEYDRWERLFDKQDLKHQREAESIRNDFKEQLQQIREQIGRSEANILAQMNLLFRSNHKND